MHVGFSVGWTQQAMLESGVWSSEMIMLLGDRTRACRKFVELLLCTGLQLIIVEQYVQPTIANGLTPWKQLLWPKLIERVLKLSLPTVYGWLIMFYSIFHLLLNIIAELTGFQDREFYKVCLLMSV